MHPRRGVTHPHLALLDIEALPPNVRFWTVRREIVSIASTVISCVRDLLPVFDN
jgi:hypothetical protein